MKLPAIIIMLVALYLLYRIACPKQVKKDLETLPEKPQNIPDVMGKSRFVLSGRSKPLQTPATSQEIEKEAEKAFIFAAGTGEQHPAVIPAGQLDEVFGGEPNPEMMSIPLGYEDESGDESETDFEAEEEAGELNRMLGHEPDYADGLDYDNLRTAVKAVREQPGEVSEETAGTLARLEDTDMFEWLVSGDEGKLNWIKAVVERNIQKTMPETEDEDSGTDYGDFVADFLG